MDPLRRNRLGQQLVITQHEERAVFADFMNPMQHKTAIRTGKEQDIALLWCVAPVQMYDVPRLQKRAHAVAGHRHGQIPLAFLQQLADSVELFLCVNDQRHKSTLLLGLSYPEGRTLSRKGKL